MLKYFLPQLAEGSFSFQVLYQDPKIDSYIKSRLGGVFNAGNGWRVTIDAEPELKVKEKVIYLRGSDRYEDEKIDSFHGLSKKEAESLQKQVRQALTELVAAVKAWKPSSRFEIVKEIIVYPDYFGNYERNFMKKSNQFIVIVG